MKLTKDELIRYVKDENIRTIRLAFCDVFGREKNISIMPSEIARAFDQGIAINASAIKDFGKGIYTELVLHPEPDTISTMPWRPEDDRALRMFCSMTYPDGTPFDQRGTKSLLFNAMHEADKREYEFLFSSELEFYLFKLDKMGKPTEEPVDEAGYLDISPEDACEKVRREMGIALEEMDVFPRNIFHEQGPGQNEIDFDFANPLTAGNNIITAKAVVKNAAQKNGFFADFAPKPVKYRPGNGLHIEFSARSYDGTDSIMENVVAGILNRICEMTLFLNPTRESYDRLTTGGSPRFVTWTTENRSQLLRFPEANGRISKAELRSPDAMVNPYLAFALLIFAGLEGIEKEMKLPPASNFDIRTAEESVLAQFDKIPQSFDEAVQLANQSDFIREHVSQDIISMYSKR